MNYENFNEITTKKLYTYRRHPMHDNSYVILKQQLEDGPYEPVGDYTVLDSDEDNSLSEKKVMNLVALMNDEKNIIDLKTETKTRLLYHKASTDEPNRTRIIFYALGEKGISTENAVLSLEEGLEDELK